MTTKTNTNPWLMDSRVRERNLKSGALTEKDLEKNLAALPDLEGQYDAVLTPQPALEQPRIVAPVVDDESDSDLDDESDSDLDDEDDDDDDGDDAGEAPAAPVAEAPAAPPVSDDSGDSDDAGDDAPGGDAEGGDEA